MSYTATKDLTRFGADFFKYKFLCTCGQLFLCTANDEGYCYYCNLPVSQCKLIEVFGKGDTDNMKKHSTGATRSTDKDKYRYDLISPIALRSLAETLKEGAERYGEYNWENGFPITDILNHALGHIYDYLSGDRSEDHLGHLMANCMFAIHSEKLWPHLNDNLRKEGCSLPDKYKKESVNAVEP